MRAKPVKVRRLEREDLLRTMKKFVRHNARRPTVEGQRVCSSCGSTSSKRGCKPGCQARELLWNIERELWLLQVR